MQFSPESLTPICSSLQRFTYGFKVLFFSTGLKRIRRPRSRLPSRADSAFVFRHFPQLKEFDPCKEIDYEYRSPLNYPANSIKVIGLNSSSRALPLLYEQQQIETNGMSGKNSSEQLGRIKWTLNAPFHGDYLLIFLTTCLLI